MSQEFLYGIIVLLIGGHYASLVYRLHKVEADQSEMRKDYTASVLAAANGVASAAVAASNAVSAAAEVIKLRSVK